jgi:hypothetical protein
MHGGNKASPKKVFKPICENNLLLIIFLRKQLFSADAHRAGRCD